MDEAHENSLKVNEGIDLSKYHQMNKEAVMPTEMNYENRIGKRQVVGQINGERMRKQKEERWKEIEKWYDPNKSDNANLAVLHRKGVKCSINTLKTWKRNR